MTSFKTKRVSRDMPDAHIDHVVYALFKAEAFLTEHEVSVGELNTSLAETKAAVAKVVAAMYEAGRRTVASRVGDDLTSIFNNGSIGSRRYSCILHSLTPAASGTSTPVPDTQQATTITMPITEYESLLALRNGQADAPAPKTWPEYIKSMGGKLLAKKHGNADAGSKEQSPVAAQRKKGGAARDELTIGEKIARLVLFAIICNWIASYYLS